MSLPTTITYETFDDESETFQRHDSTRQYTTHEVDSTVSTGYSYGPVDKDRAIRPFYEDDETGIITRDVRKFEAWMARISPPSPAQTTAQEAFDRGDVVTCADLGHEGSWSHNIKCADPNAHSPFNRAN